LLVACTELRESVGYLLLVACTELRESVGYLFLEAALNNYNI